MKTLRIKDISEVENIAREILKHSGNKKIFAFYGELGAGKTTIIKSICKILHAQDTIASPTFSLINEYLLPDGSKIFHIDLYRIENIEEIYDFGYEEYLFSNHYCLIEWAEKIEQLLPDNVVKIKIEVVSEHKRLVHIEI